MIPTETETPIEQAKRTIENLADALMDIPIYTVFASDEPPSALLLDGWCLGCTSRSFDLALQPWLEAQGHWRGRSPAVFIDDIHLHRIAFEEANYSEDTHSIFGQTLTGILLHELAHVAESAPDFDPPTPENHGRAMALISLSHASEADLARPANWGHGPIWVRAALHLHQRAKKIGHATDIQRIYCGADYDIPEPTECKAALKSEKRLLAGVSIFNIRMIDAPPDYQDLWSESET